MQIEPSSKLAQMSLGRKACESVWPIGDRPHRSEAGIQVDNRDLLEIF